jgi:hypothetical protein
MPLGNVQGARNGASNTCRETIFLSWFAASHSYPPSRNQPFSSVALPATAIGVAIDLISVCSTDEVNFIIILTMISLEKKLTRLLNHTPPGKIF